jgi:NAD(P)-dependent dehydrogenase (short-subunit alcohol dehydrogenase family)
MHYPRLDGVLHNAGLLGDICPMEEQKPEVWQQVMQVNVNGTFMLTQALLPLLLRSDRARWSSPRPASVVRAAPTGAPMRFPNSPPKG